MLRTDTDLRYFGDLTKQRICSILSSARFGMVNISGLSDSLEVSIMSRKRRIRVFSAIIALLMLFTVLFLTIGVNHCCRGDGCAVCAQIRAGMNLLRIGMLALCLIAAALPVRHCFPRKSESVSCAWRQTSLVFLKIKLSD